LLSVLKMDFDASFGRIWPQILLAFSESFSQSLLCLFCAKHTTSMTQPKTTTGFCLPKSYVLHTVRHSNSKKNRLVVITFKAWRELYSSSLVIKKLNMILSLNTMED
jgi:hypothetical protein